MFRASKLLQSHYESYTLEQLFIEITNNYSVDETAYLKELLTLVAAEKHDFEPISEIAKKLINRARNVQQSRFIQGIDAFLQQYNLSTQEGIVLMCLAEALLRIPDTYTADALIEDKFSGAQWDKYINKSDSLLVNASTWGLLLTGKLVTLDKPAQDASENLLNQLINRVGEPVIRKAMYSAMKLMGKQFVLGRTIDEAIENSAANQKNGYCHSYDMLGEAAITEKDAAKYYQEYANAIKELGKQASPDNPKLTASISIKLSALHPRYEAVNQERVMTELYQTLISLVKLARTANVAISIDAEEADRLELSLVLFSKLYQAEETKGWGLLGIVVQAYSKRALPVLVWLNKLASSQGDEIPVRLVKGAYWDSEIKQAQINGEDGYPLYTRKAATDVSYLACAQFLLSQQTQGNLYPQFATHNAQTIACILNITHDRAFELQRLHGMGQALYDTFLEQYPNALVRIYAPVGQHQELLPYLVRRLLENGANSSFVHKLMDPKVDIERLIEHPIHQLNKSASLANTKIPIPNDIYGINRKNSYGLNLAIQSQRNSFLSQLNQFQTKQWHAMPLVGDAEYSGEVQNILSPYDTNKRVGQVNNASQEAIEQALQLANNAVISWGEIPVCERADKLNKLADLLEENRSELIALCTQEAGKTIQDGIDEVREAVDFCRYYANAAEALMSQAKVMAGPTGETNHLYLQGRGIFICISPWNFPLAIFLGQITAALAAGNCVIAKPAQQTPLIGFRAIELAHEAGIPKDVLQFLPGDGEVGANLTQDERIAGVCFTGSTQTAKHINLTLAQRQGPIIPIIAETGGQNAMLVDSTCLPEQLVTDIIDSAFTSAGQRCSALRVLYLQTEIADAVIELLVGAMAQLTIGDPNKLNTDSGPVIDAQAKHKLIQHINDITKEAKLIYSCELPVACEQGYFVPPTLIELSSITQLKQENFGPILHVIRYQASELDRVIDDINGTGYGLTFGIHSRNESFAKYLAHKIKVGNVYINRNQVGAVVGVQPFGGQGLSGTGPKAGGPHYLLRFVTEKVITNNITAIGGNTSLLILNDEDDD